MSKKLIFKDGKALAGVTMKDLQAAEKGNQALHVAQDPMAVIQNRKLLSRDLDIPVEQWILPHQSHSDTAVRVTPEDAGNTVSADALYTKHPGLLIGVYTADCCSLLLYDPSVPLISAVHSGWRGTAGAITWKTMEILKKEGLQPETTQVWFGPSLQFESLEVGPEVVEAMKDMAKKTGISLKGLIRPGEGDRFYIDNQGLNIEMLKKSGIPEENIFPSPYNTGKDEENCFSYRRDVPLGEHFSFITLKEEPDAKRNDG